MLVETFVTQRKPLIGSEDLTALHHMKLPRERSDGVGSRQAWRYFLFSRAWMGKEEDRLLLVSDEYWMHQDS